MLRFVTAGESHGQALIAWISGLPAGLPVDLEFISANCTGGNWDTGAAGGSASRRMRRIFWPACVTGRPSARRSRVRIENRDWKNWEKALPVRRHAKARGSEERAAAVDGAAAGPRGPGGGAEIQFSRCAVRAGAGFGAGDGGAGGGGSVCEIAFARVWRGGSEPYHRGGPRATGTRGDVGRNCDASARIWNRRCAAWIAIPKRG